MNSQQEGAERSGAGCQQHCGPRRKPPIVSVPVLHNTSTDGPTERKRAGFVWGRAGETGDSQEEGKAERSRLGEWLERGIGQREGWEESKRPIVGAGGREVCK